ncbi:MAG: methylenetetrahydrofolate reductase [Pseudothermotoga sp.]|uniref:methylenetetrahydrofolate reductase n=1 Tax=Pseudothermotoga sp. TaxID=2033661 RepID=UPI00199EC74E|nr:methylenetetrahydrofolate reductase [Pseudothermotoga sp.]
MKLIDKLKEGPILSIEVLPPNRGHSVEEIFRTIDQLMEFPISFINVTRHAPELAYIESDGQIVRVTKVKRPGTVGLSAALMHRYGIDVVPHVICYGMDKYQIEDLLIDLHLIGISNVFVVRGEYENPLSGQQDRSSYKHAVELVQHIANLNRGVYLYPTVGSEPTDFCIGVAGYPEKHFEAPNMEEDLMNLKRKVEAGAHYIVTQMVFDVEIYRRFVQMARNFGIHVPIIPGVKPVVNLKSIYSIPKKFFVTIPASFVSQMHQARSSEEEFIIGVRFAAKLAEDLLVAGAPGIHVFTMGRAKATKAMLQLLYSRQA